MPASHKGGSGLISRKAASKRTPVNESQARFFSALGLELVDEYRLETDGEHEISLSAFFDLPAYHRLLKGAYACGFVCRDFTPDFPIETVLTRPAETLGRLGFMQLRHYLHTLFRAERWADGYSSPIRSALEAGALTVVCERLSSDERLYDVS